MVASLAITIFQTLVFALFGPSLLFFGSAARTVGVFVQAVLASGWMDIITAIKALELCNVFFTFNVAVMVFTGAVALAVAMIGNPKIDFTAKGMLLFYILAEMPMKLLAEVLFKNVAKCTSVGDPDYTFPNGRPIGPAPCNCDHGEFICALYLTKVITWTITFIGAYVGNRCWKVVGAASYAMAGAVMVVKTYTELVLMIMLELSEKFPDTVTGDTVTAASTSIATVELFLVYGLAAIGFFLQVNPGLGQYIESVKDSLTSGEEPEKPTGCSRFLMCRCFKKWLRVLMRADAAVTRLIAAGQAATAIAKSNTAQNLAEKCAEADEKAAEEKAKEKAKKAKEEAKKEQEEAEKAQKQKDASLTDVVVDVDEEKCSSI